MLRSLVFRIASHFSGLNIIPHSFSHCWRSVWSCFSSSSLHSYFSRIHSWSKCILENLKPTFAYVMTGDIEYVHQQQKTVTLLGNEFLRMRTLLEIRILPLYHYTWIWLCELIVHVLGCLNMVKVYSLQFRGSFAQCRLLWSTGPQLVYIYVGPLGITSHKLVYMYLWKPLPYKEYQVKSAMDFNQYNMQDLFKYVQVFI